MPDKIEYAPARAQAGPRTTLWVLRITALLHVSAAVLQPFLAGMYLGGDVDAIGVHGGNASLVMLLAFAQSVAAVAYIWPGGGRVWPLGVSLALFLAEGFQIGMGYGRNLPVHIPLGVTIIVSQVLLTVWVFRSTAQGTRRWGRRR